MEEIWKPCHIWGDKYLISNFGGVKSLGETWFKGKNSLIQISSSERLVKSSIDRYGYLKVTLSKNKEIKFFTVHRLVALAFLPNPLQKETVNHIDGNKLNNNINNLEWLTAKENQQHGWKIGLYKGSRKNFGSKSRLSKLNDDLVREIKKSELSTRLLANKYGVHHSIIGGIKKGIRWPHVI